MLEHNGFVPSGRPRHLQWRIRPEESFFGIYDGEDGNEMLPSWFFDFREVYALPPRDRDQALAQYLGPLSLFFDVEVIVQSIAIVASKT